MQGLRFSEGLSAQEPIGRTLTTVAKCALDISQFGGTYENKPVIVDGNVVSARTYHDNTEFMKQFIRLLKAAL